ncbi:MAG: GAF domain-containing protein [Desulfuromonadaceae bacterium]|nr:GAF domain-containing protein [Desulfuromonadaceae bacterium]
MTKKLTESARKLRHRAEEKFRAQTAASQVRRTPEQTERLLHELQVHQIELEMQNEELINAQSELATLKARYLHIYDQAPVGFLTVSEQGVVVAANSTVTAMLGVEKHSLLGKPISQFIYGEDRGIYRLHHKKIYSGMEVQTWEMRMMLPDGSSFWSHLLATPAEEGELWVVFDITERKRVEQVLLSRLRISEFAFGHSLEKLLTKLVDEAEALTGSHIGFVHFVAADESILTLQTWSSNTLSTFCTNMTKGMHQPLAQAGVWADCVREKKPLIHNEYASLSGRKGLPPGHVPIHRELVVPIVRNNAIVAVLGVGNKPTDYTIIDIKIIEKLTNLAWDFVALKQSEIDLVQAHAGLEVKVVERTAELVRTHEKMKKISFDLLWAEERERERIAGELHDRVGQALLLAKMKFDALADLIIADEKRTLADEATSLLAASIKDIRSLTFRMRPPLLDSSPIEDTLKWLCSSMGSDYALTVTFVSEGQAVQLTAEMRYSLYQAVRELLLNVVKHAGVKAATLSIKSENECVLVQVKDDGVGSDKIAVSLTVDSMCGYGLYNVRQRIEQMGGRFAVVSSPGKGTTATIMLPLANLQRRERNLYEHNSSFGRRSSDFS